VAKKMVFEDEARQPLAAGVSKLARAVTSTLGPRGRNAVLDKGWGAPKITKDGVTVAEDIELVDPDENLGAQLVKEAASKTNDVAGDGTTTATVLAEGGVDPSAAARRTHQLWFEGEHIEATIYDRHKLLAGNVVTGPAVVAEMDSTTLVLPGHAATVHPSGSLLIRPIDSGSED